LTLDDYNKIVRTAHSLQTQEQREMRRELLDIGPVELTGLPRTGDLVKKIGRFRKLQWGDYNLKLDEEAIGRGLLNLSGGKPWTNELTAPDPTKPSDSDSDSDSQ
jgi:hypothetical protein